MTRIGMDVDAVESIGRQMIAKAATLGSVGATAGRLIQHGHSLWQGNTSRHWFDHWVRDEAAVRRLVQDLDAMGRKLLAQAKEQRDASAATGVGQLSGRLGQLTPNLWESVGQGGGRALWHLFHERAYHVQDLAHAIDRLRATDPGLVSAGAISSAVGFFGAIGSNAAISGAYSQKYLAFQSRIQKVMPAIDDDFFKYKRALAPAFEKNGLAQALSESKFFDRLGRVGTGLSVAEHVAVLSDDRQGGAERVGAFFELGADGLKSSKNPVAYLGGMAISSVDMAAQAAAEADFSKEGISMVADEIRKNPGVLLEEGGKAIKTVFTEKIWSIF